MPEWRIELLGGLRAHYTDVDSSSTISRFRTQKTASLLAYLAYFRGRAHPRELLADLLWPDDEAEAGRHSLSMALSSLRQQFDAVIGPEARVDDLLIADRHAITLLSEQVVTDAAAFETAARAAMEFPAGAERLQCLLTAVDLYRGELLPGYPEEWIAPEQRRLEALFARALRELVEMLKGLGDLDRALEYALHGVTIDPLSVEAHYDLIRLYALTSRPAAALRQYRELKQILWREFEAAPAAATEALVRAIEAAEPPVLARPTRRLDPTTRLEAPAAHASLLEAPRGAVPLDSPLYVIRACDHEFAVAASRGDSIILVKGARQMGKTSLLARGLQAGRDSGRRLLTTDLEKLSDENLATSEALFQWLNSTIADQLDLPPGEWSSYWGAAVNFERFVRRDVLTNSDSPLLWVVDGVDRLFTHRSRNELFRLFRSWHNGRVMDPTGPWSRLTLALGYATEVHLFLPDLNESPFNVGTRIELSDLSPGQVMDLNYRYGSPLRTRRDVAAFQGLFGGHPYLVRRGLHEMVTRGQSLRELSSAVETEDGPWGDHIRGMFIHLAADPELEEAVRGLLRGKRRLQPTEFYRLRTAGVLVADSESAPRFRCGLYERCLKRHLLSD